MIKAVKEIIEQNGWNIYESKDFIELQQYSPAGEDFSFSVSKKNTVNEIIDYASNFDEEEHAVMWYGQNRGEPSSLRTLLKDAHEISLMLMLLSNSLVNNLIKGAKENGNKK